MKIIMVASLALLVLLVPLAPLVLLVLLASPVLLARLGFQVNRDTQLFLLTLAVWYLLMGITLVVFGQTMR
jgi:hypothetical protein